MLVTKRGADLVLVTQVDHGSLAGDFATHWGNARFARPDPFDSVHYAAAMHDEGWRQADEQPLFNANERRPLHFLEIPMEEHVPLYGRGIAHVADKDEYAGLLVGMHWTGLYRSRWGWQGSVVGLQTQHIPLEALQDRVVREEEARWVEVKLRLWSPHQRRSDFESQLWHNYELLQTWDLLSLFVCVLNLEEPPPADSAVATPIPSTLRSIEQRPGNKVITSVPAQGVSDRVDLTLKVIARNVVTVDPYPFDATPVRFHVAARAIPARSYASGREVDDALGFARTVELVCEMHPEAQDRGDQAPSEVRIEA